MNLIEAQIDQTISNFNFYHVYKTMMTLDWEWAPLGRVPNVGELREAAESLLGDAVKSNGISSTGGFEAAYSKEDNLMVLRFIVDDITVYGYTSEDDGN